MPLILLVCQFLKLQLEGLLALAPAVTFLLAVETPAIVVFTDLGGLSKADQKPIIVPGLQGITIVKERRKDGISLWHPLCQLGVELHGVDSIPVIPFISWWLLVIVFCRLWRSVWSSGHRLGITSACQSIRASTVPSVDPREWCEADLSGGPPSGGSWEGAGCS